MLSLLNQKLLTDVEICIEKLLHSQIPLREISEGSGVSESTLKKLSSGEQKISNTKFAIIESLYCYYQEVSVNVDLYNLQNSEVQKVRLPKKIRDLIEDIDKTIDEINQDNSLLNEIQVRDLHSVDNMGNITFKEKRLTIDQWVGLGRKKEELLIAAREPYRLIVETKIENTIDNINGIRIIFNKQALIHALKQIKFDGGKVDIYKGQGKNISVNLKNTSLRKYENYDFIGAFEQEFFSIEYT
ncbi:hypothetical protein [Staphylococcus simulans]|uniref:hypothetical protein n=1 Tax=Staphylococcus simulans TaxID=1286 RepID=UPI000D1E1311|nr:hypothetical protein [Staphylococcus simulans]PTJ36460.1 hypothetical protein BU024_10375 [Staphylococcus simulans]